MIVVGACERVAPGMTRFLCDCCGKPTYIDSTHARTLLQEGVVIRCVDCMATGSCG